MTKPKIVCMCQGGNSRSVALAFLFKYQYGCDALACSYEQNTPETLRMLFSWADKIFVMQPHFLDYVEPEFKAKTMVIDVGPDIWCNGLHSDLIALCNKLLKEKAAA